jgi:phage terminase large subunit
MTTETEVRSPYAPREQFASFHARSKRFAAMVAHRRAGKTVACVNDLIAKATYAKRPRPRYAYIGPLRNQAKQIAWDYLKHYSKGLTSKVSESELYVEFKHNEARVSVYGADNPDAFRGLYFDGVILDEYGQMNPMIYTQILLPTIADRRGWIVFIGTPEGKNHFYQQYVHALADPENWFSYLLRASESGILSREELEIQRREMADDDKFEREFECSFEAMVQGEYYSKLLAGLEREHRVTSLVEYDPGHTVEVASDLGYTDSSAYWFWQNRPDGIALIDYEEHHSEPLEFYFDLLKGKGYDYEKIWLPHDARAKSLQTGRSTVEQYLHAGFPVDIVPSISVQHGIDAARKMLPLCWFNPRCAPGIEALRAYRRKWDPMRKILSEMPFHDWCLAADTRVLTPAGWRKVRDLSIHDQVLTPGGARSILRSGIVRNTDQWTTIHGIRCTPEHRFFTYRGLIEAGNLRNSDKLWTQDSWGLKFLGWLCATLCLGLKTAITSATHEGSEANNAPSSFIGWSTKLCMGKFRKALKSITETTIHSIITPTILKHFPNLFIAANTNHVVDMFAPVGSVEKSSVATKGSVCAVAKNANAQITLEPSESAEPAYNLTVAVDECYFVQGDDGRAYLVSNSSHGADAFRYFALVTRERTLKEEKPQEQPREILPEPWTLSDLFNEREERLKRRFH